MSSGTGLSTVVRERIVPFTSGDGFQCNLINIRTDRESVRGPVLLIHGAGVRANMFRPPHQRTLIDCLLDDGYDVWLENWRACIDFPPNRWTLDQAAVFDHPVAVRTVVEATGCERLKAIVHCQGSTSFFMAAMAGLTPQVGTIISNAVAMHVVVPRLSLFKLWCTTVFRHAYDFLNPQWGLDAPTIRAKLLNLLVQLTHRECDNPVCKHVSFTYGAGFPSLWRHENLSPEVHAWISHEFGQCPMTFFHQMLLSARAGRIVAVEGRKELPPDVLAQPPQTDARVVFLAGEKNLCYLPESQVLSFEYLNARRKGYHGVHVFPGYSHLDVFFGKDASRDVFPIILHELNKSV